MVIATWAPVVFRPPHVNSFYMSRCVTSMYGRGRGGASNPDQARRRRSV
jgi:hypothetical protein